MTKGQPSLLGSAVCVFVLLTKSYARVLWPNGASKSKAHWHISKRQTSRTF